MVVDIKTNLLIHQTKKRNHQIRQLPPLPLLRLVVSIIMVLLYLVLVIVKTLIAIVRGEGTDDVVPSLALSNEKNDKDKDKVLSLDMEHCNITRPTNFKVAPLNDISNGNISEAENKINDTGKPNDAK
jgi:hypothetical protein